MSLSFKDSLKKNIETVAIETENTMETENIEASIATMSIDDMPMGVNDMDVNASIMTLDEVGGIAAYAGDDGNWIEDKKYVRYTQFSDNNISTVNDKKDILLHENQFNITQEQNSQYIPFEMSRYYDGFDLTKAIITICYETSNGIHGHSAPINVTYNDEKIRFGWLVDARATTDVGRLNFEIHATGTVTGSDNKPLGYIWKTKRNKDLNVLESFCDNIVNEIDDSWLQELVTDVAERVAEEIKNVSVGTQVEIATGAAQDAVDARDKAKEYADDAASAAIDAVKTVIQDYATNAQVEEQLKDYAKTEEVTNQITTLNNKFGTLVNDEGSELTVEDYVAKKVEEVDVSDELGDLGTNEDGTTKTVVQYVNEAIDKQDISGKLINYYTISQTYNREQIDEKVSNVTVDLSDYYTKSQVDEKDTALSTSIGANTEGIIGINSAISSINLTLESIDKTPNAYYVTTYNEPYTVEGTEYTGENTLVLYKTDETDNEESRSVVSTHVITGGSGGSVSANTIKIERKTASPLVLTSNDEIEIEYEVIGTDASGEDIGMVYVTWKIGNKTVVNKQSVYTGINKVNLTDYINIGSDQKVTLIVNDDIGTVQQKIWYVSVVDVRLNSNFDDTKYYTANSPVEFTFTPYGAVDKTVHFLLNGEEIGAKTSVKSAAGLLDSYTIPAQEHGSYLLEVYMTAEINEDTIESNHIFKDIIWFDSESDIPVIGTIFQNFTARQYDATNIEYTVYDPSTETPTVEIAVNGDVVSTPTLETAKNRYTFKTDVVGEHIITITCGEVVKTLTANITKLDIDVSPVTAGLAFDFNPSGKSNNDADRIWTDGTVSMSVSDNFDWVNGGYQYDENGDQYFCVKAGTTATIDYNLFADDAKTQGKEFKVTFKTTNIKNRNTSFISCMNSGIGLDMKVQDANIYSSNSSLYSPYCEEDIIEYEFNINTIDDMPLVLTYEDGVACRPMSYTSDASFWQTNPQPITIGSDNCDVHIYRMKAYARSLSDSEILSNFIMDARNANEMVDRYNRNQIYTNQDGVKVLTPEGLAEACPDLRVIVVDAPWFTNDKDNKVDNTTITMIYKNGRPEDNWTCTGSRHSGQGTSSNEYGYAGRNIDLIMNRDTSLFKWIGEDGKEVESKTITLTETSVPTDYLNVKVNIASSENQNNAQMARRYNMYNPFIRSAKFNDSRVKDCMEFYNCVIFVRENDPDISTHREFKDCETHFYAIGNVGDSKKTDNTRVNDKNDPRECAVEISDYNVPLAEFPTGNGNEICDPSNWKEGNAAYDLLHNPEYSYDDGDFDKFGSESYNFRYEMKNITEEQREVNINAWRDFYKFVVTSTDDEFYNRLKEYFVVDSALYYYLFTERYTMVDNRAKNSFWHIGKVYITETEAESLGNAAGGFIIDNEQAAINDGYRWDLTWGYDFDTSLGIDNTGKLVLTYGKEDTDYYVDGDPSSSYIYRAAESTFFCRIRELFKSELQAMFVDRESSNAWSANGLISQWDEYQNQFPEELWRLDIQRKYIRTYRGISVDNSIVPTDGAVTKRFLEEMLNGRKRYQRRMFERNQELYMATKYFGKTATQDQIMMRFNNPESYVIKPNFNLYITPYSDMYIGVSFYNGHQENFRAKAGIEYTVYYPEGLETSDITLIYGASFIQAIGDLSKCYVGRNDFSKASRLQRLVIGSDVEGYSNNFMESIELGNNKLLEYLDVRNVTGLSSPIDLSQCGNLLELYAQGSGTKGVVFANGGKVQKFYLPSITSLIAKNLNYIEDFNIESYINLQTLVVENTPAIDTHEIVDATLELQSSLSSDSVKLNVLRLIGINWNIENADILEEVILLRGQNSSGGEIPQSILAGDVYVPVIREKQLQEYKETWPDLEITHNDGGLILQNPVTFLNYDGTVLEVQYVDKGERAVDPVSREENPIPTPTKESTVSTDYTYAGWDNSLESEIFVPTIVTATYTESIRKYKIKYISKGTVVQESEGDYGTFIPYTGATPTYTLEEEKAFNYYLFNRWDKSGFVDGEKTVNAIFDSFKYTSGAFNEKKLSDLSPVEIYALIDLSKRKIVNIGTNEGQESEDYAGFIADKDRYSFALGHDFNYDDVPSVEIIGANSELGDEYKSTVEFVRNSDGTGTYLDTGIQLFDEDKDFVLAIEYEFTNGTADSVLAQCCRVKTNNGFKLLYNNGAKLKWCSNTTSSLTGNNTRQVGLNEREMIVIQHKKGNPNLTIYSSNLSGMSVYTETIDGVELAVTNTDTLIFGCEKQSPSVFANFASGKIYWAKVWYKDLGNDVCRELASWIHEDISFQTCGFNRYFVANSTDDEMCTFSLLATHLLERTKRWNPKNNGFDGTGNIGGWAKSELNKYLNSRLYNSLPVQIKSLIKEVEVYSTIGNSSNLLSTSNCYITIPAVVEVAGAPLATNQYNKSPFTDEGKYISYIIEKSQRQRTFRGESETVDYWTRSPYAYSDPSHTSAGSYIYRVTNTGDIVYTGNQSDVDKGVLIMISF